MGPALLRWANILAGFFDIHPRHFKAERGAHEVRDQAETNGGAIGHSPSLWFYVLLFATLKGVVDGTYRGAEWMSWVKEKYRIVLEPVLRTEEQKGFSVLPRRWVVERTLAWLNQFRRLSKDYEELPTTSETFIYMAMTRLMLRRLAAWYFSDRL
jgi:transposase